MLLALPESHPLASMAELLPAELAGQEWIAVGHRQRPHGHDHFVAACAIAGGQPGHHDDPAQLTPSCAGRRGAARAALVQLSHALVGGLTQGESTAAARHIQGYST